jgi:uncharacterized protein YidB (DUF937 family)
LLDSVIGALAGGQGGNSGGQGGGTQAAMLNLVIAMLANRQGGAQGAGDSGGLGGLGDLIGKFTRGGMGDVIGSWVGHGRNAPISGDQLSNVLDSDTIGNIAAQLGLSHGEAASQLSQLLPQVVDQLTPQGHAPEGGLGSIGDIGELLAGRRACGRAGGGAYLRADPATRSKRNSRHSIGPFHIGTRRDSFRRIAPGSFMSGLST